jgi:hypothetical protein
MPNAPSAEMNAAEPAVQAVARTASFDQRFFFGRGASVIVVAVVVRTLVLVVTMVVRTLVLVVTVIVRTLVPVIAVIVRTLVVVVAAVVAA